MEWLNGLFTIHSALQTIVVLALVCCVGIILGKIRIRGISLGVAFVFFTGIVAGNFHLSIDQEMLNYAETFGLVLFVYTLGLYVGPNFWVHYGTKACHLTCGVLPLSLLVRR